MHNRLNYFSIDNPYSFQGTEKDNEVKGQGNSVNYKYRMHDPRVGRFFAIDPLALKYPYNGSYNFSENRVIDCGELEGLEIFYAADGTKLGVIGTSVELRVVKANDVKKVQKAIALANFNLDLAQKEYNKIKNSQFTTVTKAYIKVKATLFWKAYEKNKDAANNSSTPVNMTEEELNTRAFLTLIRNAESGNKGPLDYNVNYGGTTFSDYSNHPEKSVSKWNRTSDAAGAYQIESATWDIMVDLKNFKDFSPLNQDAAALEIIKEQVKYNSNKSNLIKNIESGDVLKACALLNTTWTSLPGGAQSSDDINDEWAKKIFKDAVKNELNEHTVIETPQGNLNFEK